MACLGITARVRPSATGTQRWVDALALRPSDNRRAMDGTAVDQHSALPCGRGCPEDVPASATLEPPQSGSGGVTAVGHRPTGGGWPSTAAGCVPTAAGQPNPATDDLGPSLARKGNISFLKNTAGGGAPHYNRESNTTSFVCPTCGRDHLGGKRVFGGGRVTGRTTGVQCPAFCATCGRGSRPLRGEEGRGDGNARPAPRPALAEAAH